MAGVPNELWKQLTSLIGEDFDEGVEDQAEAVEGPGERRAEGGQGRGDLRDAVLE